MRIKIFNIIHFTTALLFTGILFSFTENESSIKPYFMSDATTDTQQLETATFGTGCFWCTEAIFQQLDGVGLINLSWLFGKNKPPKRSSHEITLEDLERILKIGKWIDPQ